ncbi:uncharacterized protein LOC132401918 [Hypanus sabinus]|uniref:uncharacterized protein LOC132401918 n=1 Tax=Hypanus sabinus TaxID=79690 RepID=UPI0028C3AC46|nr:uncharacterized protein LOC132401918 [Hypanus sabinus]
MLSGRKMRHVNGTCSTSGNKNKMRQDEFLASLRSLAETYNLCSRMSDSLLRDKIVLGINDSQTRKRLLQERKLTLNNCIDICKSTEMAESHLQLFSTAADSRSTAVHGIKPRANKKGSKHPGQKASASGGARAKGTLNSCRSKVNPCKYCGTEHVRDKQQCPAYGQACGIRNHFAKVCKQKPVHRVEAQSDDQTDSDSSTKFIDNVILVANSLKTKDDVFAQMLINGKPIDFQDHSRSSINILPRKYLEGVDHTPRQCTKKLMMWNKTTMDAEGMCRVKLHNPTTNRKYSVKFVVVTDNFTTLLGSRASQQMKLIMITDDNFCRVHVSTLKEKQCTPEECYEEVFFDALRELPGAAHLQIDAEVQPTALSHDI